MKIGIDASRAFLKHRTGIEEYSYQLISHLRSVLPETVRVVLYVRSGQETEFDLPSSWEIKALSAPRLWTQGRLSWEMFLHPPDVLFVPAHTIPFIHPRRTVVTVHGLEYEFYREGYSWWEHLYMRLSIRFSCGVADRIIAVSENTKRDLISLYGVPSEKISVIYEGFEPTSADSSESDFPEKDIKPYLLFIGRLEARKNIVGILKAFELFKERTGLPHRLILAGKPGYGYGNIKKQISKNKYQNEIHELGYVSQAEKRKLLKNATAFVFPSHYEGFGLPVLEAQAAGIPVITSNTSSLPEVAGDGALLANPADAESIAQAMIRLESDTSLRADILKRATLRVSQFSWATCAREVAEVLLGKNNV